MMTSTYRPPPPSTPPPPPPSTPPPSPPPTPPPPPPPTSSSSTIPPELQHISPYIHHAQNLETNPLHNESPESRIVAHYCRIHAAQEGMAYATSDEGKQYLSELLDRVESEMEVVSIITREESYVVCRNYADGIYREANERDRRGGGGSNEKKKKKETAELYEAAATFYEILPQFYSDENDNFDTNNKKEQREEERNMQYCQKRAVKLLQQVEEEQQQQEQSKKLYASSVVADHASVSSLSLSDAGGGNLSRGESSSPTTAPLFSSPHSQENSSSSCPIPEELLIIQPFLHHATNLDSDPNSPPESQILSYYCRMHAVHVGMTTPSLVTSSPTSKEYIASLLSQLEEEGENIRSVISREESYGICKNYATKIYSQANAQDKLFKVGRETAELFEMSAVFFEILEQFYSEEDNEEKSEVRREEEEKMEYSRRRAVEILESLEAGDKNNDAGEGDASDDGFDFFAQKLAQSDSDTPFDLHEIGAAADEDDGNDKELESSGHNSEKGSNDEFGLSALLPPESCPSDKEDDGSEASIPLPTKEEETAKETDTKRNNKNDKPQASSSEKGVTTTIQPDGEVVHIIDQLDDEIDNAMEDFNQSTVTVLDEEAIGSMIHFTEDEANFWSKMGFSVQEAPVADSVESGSTPAAASSPQVKPKLLRPSILRTVIKPASTKDIMENEKPSDYRARDSHGLPKGGNYFKATLPDGHFGAIFFRASEMRNKLYATAPRSFIKSLKNRPVVAYTSSDSVIDSAGICLGDVILKVQDDEVEDPKKAMYFVHELRNRKSSFAGIDLYVWRPPPTIDVMPSENQCMVEYHSRNIDAPSSSSGWKAKYVVVGGIVAKPHIINMYYNKKDYDKAVAETLMKKRKLSVKVKSWSLQGARLITQKLNFVHYEDKKEPWYYFVVSTSKGKAIKIAHPIIDGINPVLEGVKRALKSANYGSFVE